MHNPLRLNKPPWMHIGALGFMILLMLFDFKIALHQAGQLPGTLGISLGPSEAMANNPYIAHYGTKFVAVRSDIWTCFRMRENIHFNFGFIIMPDRCQESYMVVVQTNACQSVKSETVECTIGTWFWAPNPPCGSDSPSGWYLPPC